MKQVKMVDGMISVLILTKNEERDLPGCLESVAWCDDVHVFDSFSTDRTEEVARSHGVNFHQRKFDTYAAQRNAALDELPYRHEWVFMLDADERVGPELAREMRETAAGADSRIAAFQLPRRDFFYDAWLKHASISPFSIRLVRRGRARYTRGVHEFLDLDGELGKLRTPFDHLAFSKGISYWIRKHDGYSTMEAGLIASGTARAKANWGTALFGRDFFSRRAAQKAIFYRMPGRPLMKWMYMMFVRRAILDGKAGITYATLQSIYEYMIVLKTREIERSKAGVR